jgi:hypothetical protein
LDDIKPRIDTTRFENGSELHTSKQKTNFPYDYEEPELSNMCWIFKEIKIEKKRNIIYPFV